MLRVLVPGWRELELEHLVLDMNGTLTCDGQLLPGVAERLASLKSVVSIQILSADTFGTLEAVASELGVRAQRLKRDEPDAPQKARLVRELGAERVVAVGNGANDADMLREAALGVAVLGPEGLALPALFAADLLSSSIDQALDLLLNTRRLVASLRR